MKIEDFKEYLKKVYEIEATLYSQQKLINDLTEKAKEVRNSYTKKQLSSQKPFSDFGGIDQIIENCQVVLGGCIIVAIICMCTAGFSKGLDIAFVITVIALIICVVATPIYQVYAYRKFNEDVIKGNEYINRQNKEGERKAKERAEIINSEATEIIKNQNETRRILEEYYQWDIIYPKYRNLIAISSILEYFDSGRCKELEGHEGAYNIFESEIRQNIIISRLEDVVNSLETVKANQYMLYRAVQQTQFENIKIMNTVSNLANTMNHISSNSDIIAYNSGQIAKNTEYANWLATHQYYKSPTF